MTKHDPHYAHEVTAVLIEDGHEHARPMLSAFPMRGCHIRYVCKRCGIVWQDTGGGELSIGIVQVRAGDREKCRIERDATGAAP
jgi:hypothetical protein